MAFIRRTLTQAEREEHLFRAEQLRASGVEIEIPEYWRGRNHALDIVVASPAECRVFESYTGGIFYAVLVRLIARYGVTLIDCDLRTKLDDQIVLESCRDQVYKLGSEEYRQHEVLNHRIENSLHLTRGKMVEGWILASGVRPIPTEYGDAVLPFEIVLFDQSGHEFPSQGTLSVSRRVRRDDTGVRRGMGLYGFDLTGKPSELYVGEEAGRRHRELVAQEKLGATKGSLVTNDSR